MLAARTENAALDLLSAIIEANHAGGDKTTALGAVELALERQRIWLRLAFDLRYIGLKQYEQGARRTDEIGRLLGGWRKRFSPRGGPDPGRGGLPSPDGGVRKGAGPPRGLAAVASPPTAGPFLPPEAGKAQFPGSAW